MYVYVFKHQSNKWENFPPISQLSCNKFKKYSLHTRLFCSARLLESRGLIKSHFHISYFTKNLIKITCLWWEGRFKDQFSAYKWLFSQFNGSSQRVISRPFFGKNHAIVGTFVFCFQAASNFGRISIWGSTRVEFDFNSSSKCWNSKTIFDQTQGPRSWTIFFQILCT